MAGLFALALTAANWAVERMHVSYAWHFGAAVMVLLMERVVRGPQPSPFGWARWGASLRHFARVAAIAAAVLLGYLVVAVVVIRIGWFELDIEPKNIRDPRAFWGWIWLAVVWAPLVEEWIYRGQIQPRLREAFGPRWAIFVCGLLFWVYHWIGRGGVTPVHHLLAGWLLSWSWQRTGSLVAPTLLHALGNLCLGLADLLLLTNPRLVASILGR